ncbi:hypothetical protein P171DRAFT_207663 [Karstenula rhodostoma CBS 690.94]|uniref:Uncharacterized protein n=1 Tax=Karstenula rhodostoma CBS 690.94 TaxID=1392251 RepID=A0A9P4PPV3_9PLEO|nr:hypothetical protein P171DRAFT_207663 [Karstenula rhodostoma CBS 690.94]
MSTGATLVVEMMVIFAIEFSAKTTIDVLSWTRLLGYLHAEYHVQSAGSFGIRLRRVAHVNEAAQVRVPPLGDIHTQGQTRFQSVSVFLGTLQSASRRETRGSTPTAPRTGIFFRRRRVAHVNATILQRFWGLRVRHFSDQGPEGTRVAFLPSANHEREGWNGAYVRGSGVEKLGLSSGWVAAGVDRSGRRDGERWRQNEVVDKGRSSQIWRYETGSRGTCSGWAAELMQTRRWRGCRLVSGAVGCERSRGKVC